MKLNHDCVRDILLRTEDKLDLNHALTNEDFKDIIEKYSSGDVLYSLHKLVEIDFLDAHFFFKDQFDVRSMSVDAHSFLDNIRDKNIWDKINTKIKSTVSSVSMSVLVALANKTALDIFGL